MKIQILSDLHLEGGNFDINYAATDADVLVLAGDIGRLDGFHGINLQDFLYDCKRIFENVIYVAGNHEFYFYNIYRGYDDLKKMCEEEGVYFLQNKEVVIDGIKFFGATLWTDFNNMKDKDIIERYLNDFRLMDIGTRVAKAEDIKKENDLTREYLAKTNANVIVTHHVPNKEGINPRWYGNPANYGFMNKDLDPTGELWIFGHTHDSADYWLKGTHFVCNPKGYGKENIGNFNPTKVIEI